MENRQTKERIDKIRSRQLGRLIGQLKEVKTPQVILDVVEKYWNFFYQDIMQEIQDNDKSKSAQELHHTQR